MVFDKKFKENKYWVNMLDPFEQALTFDDVLLVPQYSAVLPKDAALATALTASLTLEAPFLSAPMDTVTEHQMAIHMALAGGLGIIHKNLSIEQQVEEVRRVKRYKNGFIEHPVVVGPDDPISRVAEIRETLGYKQVPVVDAEHRLVGLITDRDYFRADDAPVAVRDRMVHLEFLVCGRAGIMLVEAYAMIREHRLAVLCVVDGAGTLVSIVTRRDREKNELYPLASKNEFQQLRVGAAIGVDDDGVLRAEALVGAGADLLVVDTAHGHSQGVLRTVRELKRRFSSVAVAAGNIVTGEAALALADAGADAVKVGIGPGSICTTRIVAGVGVPQLSAVRDVVAVLRKINRAVPVIADGGITASGDIVKALAAGAAAVMMGNMFAGTDEAPGRIEFLNGRMYKTYRGMGSVEAMEAGSRDRYGQGGVAEKKKLVPEGVSGRVPYKGAVGRILHQLSGGVRSGMGYCGARTIAELQEKARFVRITPAGVRESHPHDLGGMDVAPNYEAR